MSLTREDLHAGLHRFATKHDLERFATKQEFADLRDATACGFVETRRCLEAVAEDLASRIQRMLEDLAKRSESVNGNQRTTVAEE